MTIFDPAPSTTPLDVDPESLATPVADETEGRSTSDLDTLFTGWNDFDRLSPLTPIVVSEVHGHDKPAMTGITRTIIPIEASFENLSGPPAYDVDSGRIHPFLGNIEIGLQHDVSRALQELDEVNAEASENAFPIPSAMVHRNARFLIPRLYRSFQHPLSVYPLLDGEIAIEATVPSKDSVLVTCEPDGRILCLVNIHRRSRHAKYDRVSELPDSFIHSALAELRELAQ